MAHYEGSYPGSHKAEEVSGWAAGLIFFGSIMLMILGSFHFIEGLAALLDDSFYVVRPGFGLEIDVTTWGWPHLFGGLVLMGAGLGLVSGSTLARIIAIVATLVSALWNFYSIPYYPVWSILMLAMCLSVLWALIVHGSDYAKAVEGEF